MANRNFRQTPGSASGSGRGGTAGGSGNISLSGHVTQTSGMFSTEATGSGSFGANEPAQQGQQPVGQCGKSQPPQLTPRTVWSRNGASCAVSSGPSSDSCIVDSGSSTNPATSSASLKGRPQQQLSSSNSSASSLEEAWSNLFDGQRSLAVRSEVRRPMQGLSESTMFAKIFKGLSLMGKEESKTEPEKVVSEKEQPQNGLMDNLETPKKGKHQQYNVLLFGETGSGKSTLINYLTNYFLGGSLKNLKIAIPTKYHQATEGWKYSEQDLHDTTKSKTRDCIDYEFVKDNLSFNFIDTPGLSDTEGTAKDDEHIAKIMAAAENRGNLSAIVIVINGTVARATVNLRNTLTLLKGSVPDVLLKNLLVVLTNCSKATANFDLKQLEPWKVPKDNVFHMNNSALSMPVDDWKKDEEIMEDLVGHWEKSMKVMETMVKRIKQLGNKATHAFRDMRLKRNKIKAELHGILLEVKKLQKMQDELKCAQGAENAVATDIQKYSNFKQTKQVDFVELEEAPYHSTICMKHTQVCHENCGIRYTPTQGDDVFRGCACMQGSANCHQCECDHSTHYHDKKKPVKKTKTVEDIIHEVKALYDTHTIRKTKLQKKITDLNADIKSLKHALDAKEGDIQKCCEDLKALCSQFNFVDELQSIIDTMERDARTLTNIDARKDAESRINNFIHLANRLSEGK